MVTGRAFGEILQNAARYEEFDVPKAFLHDGMNQFHGLQDVAAFYQFYFVLEDFYAGGKTSEKEVVRAFASSDELTHILEMAIHQFTKDNDRHTEMLRRFMTAESCDVTVAGMRKFLFRIRGHLHHYSSRSTKPRGTPFNQRDFETVALLGMCIARHAGDVRIGKLNENWGLKSMPLETEALGTYSIS